MYMVIRIILLYIRTFLVSICLYSPLYILGNKVKFFISTPTQMAKWFGLNPPHQDNLQ